jgi:signal transduction histidine kinase
MTIFCIEHDLPLFSWVAQSCQEARIFVQKDFHSLADVSPESFLLVDTSFPKEALCAFVSKVQSAGIPFLLIYEEPSQVEPFLAQEKNICTVSADVFQKNPSQWIQKKQILPQSSDFSGFQNQNLQWTLLKSIVDSLSTEPLEIPMLFPWISVTLGVESLAFYTQKDTFFDRSSVFGINDDSFLPIRIPKNDPLVESLKNQDFFLLRSSTFLSSDVERFLSQIRMQGVLFLEDPLHSLLFFSRKTSGFPFSPFELQNVKKLIEWFRQSSQKNSSVAPISSSHSDWSHLKNFSTRTAAEFKNILVSIKTFTQLFPEKYKEQNFRKDFYKVMISQVSRLEQMMDTLAFFASDSHQDLKPKDLRILLQNACENTRSIFQEFCIEGLDTLTESLILSCDEKLLTKAFTEILFNSAHAMQGKGTMQCSVTLSDASGETRLPTTLSIDFTDVGHGISENQLDRVFDPFFSNKSNGLGLGLTFAKAIVESHHGTLKIKNIKPQGVQVSILLPMYTPRFSNLFLEKRN